MKRVRKEQISASISHYLKKRQISDGGDLKESVWDSDVMSLRQVSDEQSRLGDCVAYTSINTPPVTHEQQLSKFKTFLHSLSSTHQCEMSPILYPMVVHISLDLLMNGHSISAQKLLSKNQEVFRGGDDRSGMMRLLQSVSTRQEVMEKKELASFRENKFCMQLSSSCAQCLVRYLKKGDNLLLLQMFNKHFDLKIRHSSRLKKAESSPVEEEESSQKSIPPAPPSPPIDSTKGPVTMDTLTRCIKKVSSLPPCPPSVCFYSLCNTHQGVCSASISPSQSQLAAGFEDSSIMVWSLTPTRLQPETSSVNISLVHLAGDQPSDVTQKHSRIHGLDQSGSEVLTLRGHSGSVYSVKYSPDEDFLLSCSEDTTVRLWSLSTFSNQVCYRGHNYPVWDISHSPVGSFFASCSADTMAKLWSTERTYPLRSLIGHTAQVNVVIYHPNGVYLATGSSDSSIRLWTSRDGSTVRLMRGHRLGVHAMAFSPCGKLLASAGEGGQIRLWDLSSGLTLKELVGHTGVVHSLTFNSDGSLLASGGLDGTLKIWDLTSLSKPGTVIAGPLSSFSTKPSSVLFTRFAQKGVVLAAGAVVS